MQSTLQPRRTRQTWWSSVGMMCVVVGLGFAAVTVAVWRSLGRPAIGADDANIVFVYARNVAQGHGIVYNVNQGHVEGFSSTLYLLICTLGYLCTPAPEKGLLVLNFVFAVVSSVCVARVLVLLADRLAIGQPSKWLFVFGYILWMAANPAYFAWNIVSLMDSGVYSLLIVMSYSLLALMALRETPPTRRDAILTTTLVVLSLLSRPEGPAWAVLEVLAFGWVHYVHSQSRRQCVRAMAMPVAGFLVAFFGVLVFREMYFGYPLPNTYYAKVSVSAMSTYLDGRGYFDRFVKLYGPIVVLPLCLGIGWVVYKALAGKRRSPQFQFAALTVAFALTGLGLPLLEGGDHFNAFRMYQYIYPLLGVTAILPLLPFLGPGKMLRDFAYAAGLGIVLALTCNGSWSGFRASNTSGVPIEQRQRVRIEFTVAADGRDYGRRLGEMFAGSYPTLGVTAAGGIALEYPGTVYDLMGLNDVRMAHADRIKFGPKGHESFNKDVFYSLAPDIFLPVAVEAGTDVQLSAVGAQHLSRQNFENQAYKNLFADDRFKSLYRLALVRNPARTGSIAYGYFRRTYLEDQAGRNGLKIVDELPEQ